MQCVHAALLPVCLCKHLQGCQPGHIYERFLAKLLHRCFKQKLQSEIWGISNLQVTSFSLTLLLFQQTYWHCLYLKCYCQVILFSPACQWWFNRSTAIYTHSLPLADVSFLNHHSFCFSLYVFLNTPTCINVGHTQLTMSCLSSHIYLATALH